MAQLAESVAKAGSDTRRDMRDEAEVWHQQRAAFDLAGGRGHSVNSRRPSAVKASSTVTRDSADSIDFTFAARPRPLQ